MEMDGGRGNVDGGSTESMPGRREAKRRKEGDNECENEGNYTRKEGKGEDTHLEEQEGFLVIGKSVPPGAQGR